MPTIDPNAGSIGQLGGSSTTGPLGSASALGGMDSEAFLKLMVAQLRYQNPLEPSDPSDMMLQTATFTQLETMQQMVTLQHRDLGLQEAVMAAGLVGNQVTALGPDGTRTTGTVEGVRYTAAGPVLDLGDAEVTLGDVTEIRRGGGGSSADPTADPAADAA